MHSEHEYVILVRHSTVYGCLKTCNSFSFSEAGVSRNPCADTYPGSRAFSEVETRNLRDAINARAARMVAYITLHSYSQLWLTPWGAIPQRPVDGAEIVSTSGEQNLEQASDQCYKLKEFAGNSIKNK